MNKEAHKVQLCRRLLKKKISGKVVRDGIHSECSQVLFLMERTVDAGESDSVLVMGPPGCGKTTLVNTALEKMMSSRGEKFICIHLNGLVHIDDNLALKDIIRQMNVAFPEGDKITGSFADNLQFLLQALRNGEDKISKAVIFILEEFHLFCAHRNQTLLYNLFDTVQSTRGVCVVGITTRLDVTEMLEKRVKSRFSHRQLLLLQQPTFEQRIDLFKSLLSLPHDFGSDKNHSEFMCNWNNNINKLISDKRVVQLFKRQLDLDGNEEKFRQFLMVLVSELDEECPSITADSIITMYQRMIQDDKVTLLEGLSVLELCLVIAMSHQTEIYDGDPFNFMMIANRYLKFSGQNSSIHITQRPVLLKAFERIKNLELISPLNAVGRNVNKEFQLFHFQLTKDQVSTAVNNFSGLPTEVSQWASSSLI